MLILQSNINCIVQNAVDKELTWLNDYLSFDTKGSNFSAAKQAGHWDGKTRLFSVANRQFLTGLLPLVKRGAAKMGFACDVMDKRLVVAPSPGADLSWLDPVRQQPQALAACLEATRGVVSAPTGSGKSEIIAALAASVPCRWALCVPSIDLLEQLAERFERRTGEKAGRIGDGRWDVRRVTVATLQTLSRGVETETKHTPRPVHNFLATIGGVCFDEAHVLAASSFSRVPRHMPGAYWRFGFSGTPLARGDQRNLYLVGHTGPVIYKVPALDLIDAGVLAKPVITFVECDQRVPGFDWGSVYDAGIAESEVRNKLIVKMAIKAPKPGLLFVQKIGHGHKLLKMLRDAGVKAAFVWGRDTTESRAAATQLLVRGDIDVLIASTIYDQGVDIPSLASVILAGGGKSAIKALQRLGRAMRVLPDGTKTRMDLWDVADQGNPWLEEHARTRRNIYQAQGYETRVLKPGAMV